MPVKGRWASGGFLSNLEVSPDDCHLTSVLRDLGAGEISNSWCFSTMVDSS